LGYSTTVFDENHERNRLICRSNAAKWAVPGSCKGIILDDMQAD